MLVCSWFDLNKTEYVIGISIGIPKGGTFNRTMPRLFPTRDMVYSLKNDIITWDEYREEYLELLRSRWNHGLRDQIMRLQNNATLCCWEKDPQRCHRSIVAEVIKKVRPDLQVEVR